MLTVEQQKEAVNLAMKIETGTIDMDNVLDVFKNNRQLAFDVVSFWWSFNKMTRNAIDILSYHKCRQHLEKCLEVS